MAAVTMFAVCGLIMVGCDNIWTQGGNSTLGDDDAYPVIIRDIEALIDSAVVENDVPVIVRYGTRLSARIFRTSSSGAYPEIMSFTTCGGDRFMGSTDG